MKRRRTLKKSRACEPQDAAPCKRPAAGHRDALEPVLAFLVASLLVARLLTPTESPDTGYALWIAQVCLAAGAVWVWIRLRGQDYRLRWDLWDLAVWTLVAGHVLSAIAVLATSGDQRAALNMLWEWIGLGMTFFLVRQTVQTSGERAQLVRIFCTTAVILAGLGIWQTYVWYPETRAQFQKLSRELDTLRVHAASEELSPSQSRRLQQIQSTFLRQGIPMEGPERLLWENRLNSSREPFGLFALANTLAGHQLMWLLILLGIAWNCGPKLWPRLTYGSAAVLVFACVLLTKSRTAWVGLAVGLCVWIGLALLQRHRRSARTPQNGDVDSGNVAASDSDTAKRRLLLTGSLAAALAASLIGLLAATGGLDRLVFSEAPKSLRYRLQYWRGTWDVVQEHPVLGVGPGNFRHYYLEHKLPESSEEIADPHNLFLDVWVNGGLIGLVGLLALIGMTVVYTLRDRRDDITTPSVDPPDETARTASVLDNPARVIGAGAGFLLVFVYQFLLQGQTDFRLLVLLAAWLLPLGWLGRTRVAPAVLLDPTVLLASTVALLVHLLGSGGIGMPAIMQDWLVITAIGVGRSPGAIGQEAAQSQQGASRLSRLPFGLFATAIVVACILCLFSATLPVLRTSALMSEADMAAVDRGSPAEAQRLFTRAAEEDPLSAEPHRRLAELAYLRWRQSAQTRGSDFQAAVQHMQMAIERNPRNAFYYEDLGKWFAERFQQSRDQKDAQAAVRRLEQAHALYPTNPQIAAELGMAAFRANSLEKARRYAALALSLDRINRQSGHVDKYLPDSLLVQLRQLMEISKDGTEDSQATDAD